MSRWMKKHPVLVLFTGLSLGLLVGIGMLAGALATMMAQPQQPATPLQELALRATASDTGTSMSMCTGPVDDEMEGCFFLDFLTGDIQCAVINNRTGALGGVFAGNVVKDLGVEKSKKPSYLMTTGMANFVGFKGGTSQPARCLLYVLDENTGNFVAYTFQWSRTAASARQLQKGVLATVLKGNARTAGIQE